MSSTWFDHVVSALGSFTDIRLFEPNLPHFRPTRRLGLSSLRISKTPSPKVCIEIPNRLNILINRPKFFHLRTMPSDRMVPSGSEAEILTRIHDTTLQLVTLNRRLNSHRPIFRLPPELLLKIFSLIVAEWKKRLVSQNTWHQRNKDVKPCCHTSGSP